ncbi:MAG: hypothetical protein LBU04_02525, partial [Christensenellaceae bacterium]|nr:hypothetical protein [Christensenellaceae bacterium]
MRAKNILRISKSLKKDNLHNKLNMDFHIFNIHQLKLCALQKTRTKMLKTAGINHFCRYFVAE